MPSKELVVCQCILCLQANPQGCEVSGVLRSRHRKAQAMETALGLLGQAEESIVTSSSSVVSRDRDRTSSQRSKSHDEGEAQDDRVTMANIAQHRSMLKHITLNVIRESNSISRPETLLFVGRPSLQQYQDICWQNIQEELKFHSSAAKFYKYNFILSDSPANQEFSRSESTLRESLEQIDAFVYLLGTPSASNQAMLNSAQRLRGVAVDALSQLMTWKRDTWIEQGMALKDNRPRLDDYGTKDGRAIQTVDTTRFLVTAKGLNYHPLVLSSIVHVVISNLVFGLTHKGCEALLQGFQDHTRIAVDCSRGELSLKLPECIPKTLTGAFQYLNLNPSFRQYIVCPQCHCLYPAVHPYPSRCSNQPVPRAPGCQTSLLMQRRINGKPTYTPIKAYLHQDFKQWLARFLSRPGIESIVRASQHPSGRSQGQGGTVTDILGSDVIRGFLGADKLPFLRPVDGQYRLIFALSADGFNPLTNKQAKQVRSSTAIYLICLNLPLATRQLPHNMYLVGVVPGPRKLKEGEINHYLDLVVDDFTPFWTPGVALKSTALSNKPILCLAAIIPIICDALGAREVAGFPPINSMQFCIFCALPLQEIENFDFTRWSKRTCEEHKVFAEEWRLADGNSRLAMQKASHPARYTSLLRLPYFDPVSFSTIDIMHLLYLGVFQRHCRQIWGMDVKLEDGDGSRRGQGSTPLAPSDEDIEAGRLILASGRVERFYTGKIKKDVLYQLCEENNLRTGGKKRDLIHELKTFVAQRDSSPTQETEPSPSHTSPTQTTKRGLDPRDMPTITDKVKSDFRGAESRLVKGMSLKKCPNDPLKLMCYLRGLTFEDPIPVKSAMISALSCWRQEQSEIGQWIPRMDVSQLDTLAATQQNLIGGNAKVAASAKHSSRMAAESVLTTSKPKPKQHKSAVLGAGVLDAYAVDRQNMVLPSWMTAPPAKAGHTEHGKMSADQWRVFCTVNLPVTLIRIWSPRQSEPRWEQMLLNFLDMVIAVEIASLVVTSPTLIAQYEALMHRYLESLKSVYKDAPIVQNHHTTMHVGDVMRAFGPAPGFRAYATERFNYLLQRVKTNRHEQGEMEVTMTRAVCRASNLIGLLEQPSTVPSSMNVTVSRILKGDQRGTRVNDVAIGNPEDMQDIPQHRNPDRKQSQLEDDLLERLTEYLNFNGSNSSGGSHYVPYHRPRERPTDIYLHSHATFLRLLVVGGVSYHPSRHSVGSSQVLVKQDGSPHDQRPALIQSIFRHRRRSLGGTNEESFLAIRFLKPLKKTEQDMDPYRKVNMHYGRGVCPFNAAFGSLWRADLEDIVIIRPSELVCHFAWTTMTLHSIPGPCVHAQPLNRLKAQFELNEWLDESDTDFDVEMPDHDCGGGGEQGGEQAQHLDYFDERYN